MLVDQAIVDEYVRHCRERVEYSPSNDEVPYWKFALVTQMANELDELRKKVREHED